MLHVFQLGGLCLLDGFQLRDALLYLLSHLYAGKLAVYLIHAPVGVSHLLADNSGILSFRSQLLNPGCNFLAGISLLKRNYHLQPAPGLVYLVLQGINLL